MAREKEYLSDGGHGIQLGSDSSDHIQTMDCNFLEMLWSRAQERKNNVFIEVEGSYYLMGRERRILDVKPRLCPCEESGRACSTDMIATKKVVAGESTQRVPSSVLKVL